MLLLILVSLLVLLDKSTGNFVKMEVKTSILEFHSDTQQVVRSCYGLEKAGEMDKCVDLLDEWIKKQSHFTKKDFPREYLERVIIGSKGSIERSKERIEKLCTYKTMLPHLFEEFQDVNVNAAINLAAISKLTSDHDRLIVANQIGKDWTPNVILNTIKFSIALGEYIKAYDYSKSYIVISDYSQINFMDLIKVADIAVFRKTMGILQEGYGVRIKAIHIISGSKMFDVIMTIARQVFNEKTRKRINMHKSYDSLYEYVPKDLLPKEFGGEQPSIVELYDTWKKTMRSSDFRKYRKEMNEARVNESYQATDKFKDHMAGTFRTLSVD